MELLHCFVIIGLATLSVLCPTCVGSTLSCPTDMDAADHMCGERCEIIDNVTKSENVYGKILDSYLEYRQVMFVRNSCGKFQWDFSSAVLEARHIMLTIYATDVDETGIYEDEVYDILLDGNITSFRPVPGCCGVPLQANNCTAKISLTERHQLFFSLSLFRVRSFSDLDPTHCWPFMKPDLVDKTTDIAATETVQRFHTLNPPPIFPPIPSVRPPTVFEKYVGRIEAPKYASVCMFDMPKDEVMKNNSVESPYNIDSELFNRGVFHMYGYYYTNDRVYHASTPDETVQCATRSFGDSPNNTVYNMSSSNPDNSTFTCMVLWTSLNDSDQLMVKCMPHNETYLYIPVSDHKEFVENLTIIVVVSTVGTTLLVVIVIAVLWRWKRKLHRELKDSRKVPTHLDDVMNNDSGWFVEKRSGNMYDVESVDVIQKREYQNFSYIGDGQDKCDQQPNYHNKEAASHGTSSSVNSDYIQKQSISDFSSPSSDFVLSQSNDSLDSKRAVPVFHDSGLGSGESIPPSSRMLSAVNTQLSLSKLISESDQMKPDTEPKYSENSYDSGVGSGGSSYCDSAKPQLVTPEITHTGPAQPTKDTTQSSELKNDSQLDPKKHENRDVRINDRRSPVFLYNAKKAEESSKVLPGGNEPQQPASPPLTAVSCTDSGYPESPLTSHGDGSESDEDMTYVRKHDIVCDVTNTYLSKEELAQCCDGEHLQKDLYGDTDTEDTSNYDRTDVVSKNPAPHIDTADFDKNIPNRSEPSQHVNKAYSPTLPMINIVAMDTAEYVEKQDSEKPTSKEAEIDHKTIKQTSNRNLYNHIDESLTDNDPDHVVNTHDSQYVDKTEFGEKCDYGLRLNEEVSSKIQQTQGQPIDDVDVLDNDSGYLNKSDLGRKLGYNEADNNSQMQTEISDQEDAHDSPYVDKLELGIRLGYEKDPKEAHFKKDTQTNVSNDNKTSQQKVYDRCDLNDKDCGNKCHVGPYLDKQTLLPITDRPAYDTPYLDKQTLQPIENICFAQQGEGNFVKKEIA
uniref:Uncharacterized protein LOC101242916 n=1 Tax=Phallusia mammillata TaxID=59560 RepID=A0A6F9DIZ5_9ASCI|nr:uncharacterized protein LOC101242916 [Phallusia mammillata]